MDAPLTSTKARAEQNLLRSLSKPRVSKNKTGYGNQFSKTSSLAETTFYSHDDQDFDDMDPQFSSSTPSSPQNSTSADPFSKTKVDLKMAKKQRRAMALREQNIEIQEVAILASDPSKEAKKHSFTKIENKLEDKRIRHDQAYKQYKQTLSEVADSIEDHYVSEVRGERNAQQTTKNTQHTTHNTKQKHSKSYTPNPIHYNRRTGSSQNYLPTTHQF